MFTKLLVITNLILIFSISAVSASSFEQDLQLYMSEVTELKAAQIDQEVIEYLDSSLQLVSPLAAIASRQENQTDALANLAEAHFVLPDNLSLNAALSPAIEQESALYIQYIQPYTKQNYLTFLSAQQDLLERKYFSVNDRNANFVEGFLNSSLPFTRINLNDNEVQDDKYLGVSPWEITLRVEPVLVMPDQISPALLLTLGANYTVLPNVNLTLSPPEIRESFGTRVIQKTGLRFGIGTMQSDSELVLLTGAGFSVQALSLWAVYDFENNSTFIGVGLNDLSVLGKLIGWY